MSTNFASTSKFTADCQNAHWLFSYVVYETGRAKAELPGRAGKWDETTDGPALEQAVFRMCDVRKIAPFSWMVSASMGES